MLRKLSHSSCKERLRWQVPKKKSTPSGATRAHQTISSQPTSISTDKLLFSYLHVVVLFFEWVRSWFLSSRSLFSAVPQESARLEQSKPLSDYVETSTLMPCCYSTIVDPSTYDDLGLCSSLPLRVHKFAHLADKGARRAQEDWKRMVGPIKNFTGCLSPRFNGIAVAVPECIPERLEIVTYANEFAFLHDGDYNPAFFGTITYPEGK